MVAVSAYEALFCATVVGAAYAVRGGTGFGAATVAVPLLALVMPLPLVVSDVAVLTLVTSLALLWRDWRRIAWPELLRLTPYTLVGVGAGLYLLGHLEVKALHHSLGGFVILYSLYALWTAGRAPALSRAWRVPLAATTGTLGGFLGALFGGATGPVYAIYLNILNLDKSVFRVTVTTVIVFGLLARIGGYAGMGFYDGTALLFLAAAVPVMFLGTWLGDRWIERLDQKKFNMVVATLLLVSGTALLVK